MTPRSLIAHERAVLKAMIPLVMLALIKQRIILPEHLNSPSVLLGIFHKNYKKGISKMEYGISIEGEFIREAIINWKKGRKLIAIVLYASAIEQYVNQSYGLMLHAHGLKSAEIEKIVRTLNIEPKLSWLLRLVTKKEFPNNLGKRLRAIFELRNAIVHFKGIRDHPDKKLDSYSKIESELKKLRRLSISRDFRLLQDVLWKIVLEKDPDIDLAFKATDIYFARDYEKNDS
jgi:hypothetical protein